MMVEYRVRSKRVRWTRKFKTLEEAQCFAKTSWEFKDDTTVYIEKVVVELTA
jgi:hypothetical protein